MTHRFPSPSAIAEAVDDHFPMPTRRRDTLRAVCAKIAAGDVDLGIGADRVDARRRLVQIPGVGPWTAEYIAMRALADPDAFLSTDLGVKHAAVRLGLPASSSALEQRADAWRPWRAYANHHLWNSLSTTETESS